MMKKIVIILISLVLILTITPAFADDANGFYIIADIAIIRPLGLVSLAIGTGAFIVSLPFALTSGSVDTTADALVSEPFRFTFTRPLGEFKEGGGYKPVQKKQEEIKPQH